MPTPSKRDPLPGEVVPTVRLFTVPSLMATAGSAVQELLGDAKTDLHDLAKVILRTTPDKKAPVLKVSIGLTIDLRTGGLEAELKLTRRTVFRSEAVLEQMTLGL